MTADGTTAEEVVGPDRSMMAISPGGPTGRTTETGTSLTADLVRPDGDRTAGRDMVDMVDMVVATAKIPGGKEEIPMTAMEF
mmetsp:Transcript_9865/g.16449  ORF Transcript_9865/g.16449 Transcript_9865/m.16449 type:complete len:82 (-) Transcript_9865:210-455(-)